MMTTSLNQSTNQAMIILTRKQKWLYYFLGILVFPLHFLFYALFYLIIFNIIFNEQIDFIFQAFLVFLYIVLLFITGIRGRKNKKYKFLFLGMLSAPLSVVIVMIIILAMSDFYIM